jgi:cell division protein FtsW
MMKKSKKLPADFTLFLATIALFAIGILIVFDASFARAGDMKMTGNDSWYFVKRQLAFGVVGLLGMYAMMRVSLETVRKWTLPILIVSLVMLVAVMVPGVGKRANGAARWLGYGPLRFQPSELAKFAVVLYLASALAGQKFRIRKLGSGVLPHLVVIGLMAGLVLVEPDMGTASVIVLNAFILLIVAGAMKRHLISLAGIGAFGATCLVILEPYRLKRLMTFLHPMRDYFGDGYQIVHSLVALSSGGLAGQGFCEGREKFYLPAAHTDFILATLGEEAGLIGTLAIVMLFLVFTYRGLSIAHHAKSPYYTLLATGLTAMISSQALINIAVVTSSMPATGVPLPFLSYGGTALLFALIASGLLINISQNMNTTIGASSEDLDEDHTYRRRDRRAHLPGSQYSGGSEGRRTGSRAAVRR